MSSALIISKTQLLLIVLLPLLGSLVAGLFGRKIGRQASHSVTECMRMSRFNLAKRA